MTHYVDKDYNVLLNTDDGSDDVVVVPDEYVGDFKKFASFYSDPGLAPVYNSKGWILTGRINSDLPSVN